MASEIHEIFYAFGSQLNTLWLLEFGLRRLERVFRCYIVCETKEITKKDV